MWIEGAADGRNLSEESEEGASPAPKLRLFRYPAKGEEL